MPTEKVVAIASVRVAQRSAALVANQPSISNPEIIPIYSSHVTALASARSCGKLDEGSSPLIGALMYPSYDPPYDSPIEDEFVLRYVKYAGVDVRMQRQVEVNTLCGRFVLDFVLTGPSGHRIGIECDGKAFHDESRDEWRDAMIIGGGFVDEIYRIRGSDIVYNMDDVLYLLACFEPALFDPRARTNLGVIARQEVKEFDQDRELDRWHVHYVGDDGFVEGSFLMEARRRVVPSRQPRFWLAAYQYAVSVCGGQLDEVMAAYRRDRDRTTHAGPSEKPIQNP